MGGFGTWGLLYHFPNRFAAGIPICGGFNPDGAEKLVDKPIWVFHGARDQSVRLSYSTDVVDAIKAKGGEKVKLTVYPDLAHDSWTVTYDNPEIYSWLLEQKQNTETKNKVNVKKRFVRPLVSVKE
jgi:predicted peptidase